MGINIDVTWDRGQLAVLEGKLKGAVRRALGKAGSTALRDMGSEASKRIRERKRIKPAYIKEALTLIRPKGGDIGDMAWTLKVSGKAVPLVAYPHRQVKKGVSVEVNRGKRTIVKGAFVATMRSRHEGVFRRVGKARLPIKELLGSRPLDALMHEGEAQAVADRGSRSFSETFRRLAPLEIGK